MKAAKRYAKALFELATNQLDAVEKDMLLMIHTFEDNKNLAQILKDPTVSASKKLNIVKAVFENKISETSLKLIDLLGQKERLNLLPLIANAFDTLYKDKKQIKEANIVTAVPLDKNLETIIFNKVKELTGSNEIKLKNIVNPDIIGGFILNVDDKRYDASISGKLAKIKSKLVE